MAIILVYLLAGALWIIYSDRLLDRWSGDPDDTVELQTFKGLNFVATTGLIFYLILRHSYSLRRRAEAAAQISHQRFEAVAMAATDAIWDWDMGADRIWWSDGFKKLFGYSVEELEPGPEAWSSRLHPDEREHVRASIRQAVEAGRDTWSFRYRFRRKDGSYAVVLDRGYVIRDARNQAARLVGGMTDISAQVEAQEKLDQSRRQLRALSARLQSLREEDRTRIAREIHDELGQWLTALKMDLRWLEKKLEDRAGDPSFNPMLEKVVEAGELVDSAIASVQHIAAELRPVSLDSLGLVPALQHEVAKFQERTGIQCQLDVPSDAPALSGVLATAIFRIFQETMTNVARHSQAKKVKIEFAIRSDFVVLKVEDDGTGIDPNALHNPRSLGLLGMRERAAVLGGELEINPGAVCGTVVELRLQRAADDTRFWRQLWSKS